MNAPEQQPKPIYNRPRFTVMQYDWDVFKGPRAGEPAIDFPLTGLDGKEVRISDFRGKWLVIETGSSTCSMYTKNIPGMKELRAQHPDVEFVLAYVREAHPGERLHQHQTFDEKRNAAKTLARKDAEARPLLVGSGIEESYLDWILRVRDVQNVETIAIVGLVGKYVFQVEIVSTGW